MREDSYKRCPRPPGKVNHLLLYQDNIATPKVPGTPYFTTHGDVELKVKRVLPASVSQFFGA